MPRTTRMRTGGENLWRRGRSAVLCLSAVLATAVALGACGSSSGGSSSSSSSAASSTSSSAGTASSSAGTAPAGVLPVTPITGAALQPVISEAFGGPVPMSSLDAVTRDALSVAGTPATAAQIALADACVKETTCSTGHGTIKVGILDPSGQENPWHRQARAAITMQALKYPQVASITFADGQMQLATTIAAYRSLISQRVNVIVGTFDQGNALLPTTRIAAQAGILVVPFSNVMSQATGHGDIAADVTTNLCGYGTTLGTLAAAGNKSGTVKMYTGTPGNPFGGTWSPCAEKAIKAAGLSYTLGNTNWTPQGEAQAAAAQSASAGNTVATVYDYLPDGFFQKYLSLGKEPPKQVGGSAAYSTVALYDRLKAKYPNFTFNVAETQLFFPSIAITAALEKKLGGSVPLHIVPPQTVLSIGNYLPYYKANPGLPSAAQFSTMLPTQVIKTVLGP